MFCLPFSPGHRLQCLAHSEHLLNPYHTHDYLLFMSSYYVLGTCWQPLWIL